MRQSASLPPLSRRPSVAPSLCSMDAEMRRGVAWPGDAWLLTPRSTGQRRSYPVVTPTRQLTKSQDRHRSTTDHIIIVINSKSYCKDHYSGGAVMTGRRKCNSESNSFVAAAEQVCLQPFLDSDEADLTSPGRPFHTFAAATGKARPPIVDRRQVGTPSCSVEADLRAEVVT